MSSVNQDGIECRLVGPEDAEALGQLFERFRAQGVETFFHPHPMTMSEGAKRASYAGKDAYCVAETGGSLIGYGMLRGWDEGYEVPSLGIAIESAAQGCGVGRRLMEFLHKTARDRGAKKIRLRVHPQNTRAVALYKSMNYVFGGEDRGEMVGFSDLTVSGASPDKK